jgi:hypothetical protein
MGVFTRPIAINLQEIRVNFRIEIFFGNLDKHGVFINLILNFFTEILNQISLFINRYTFV